MFLGDEDHTFTVNKMGLKQTHIKPIIRLGQGEEFERAKSATIWSAASDALSAYAHVKTVTLKL